MTKQLLFISIALITSPTLHSAEKQTEEEVFKAAKEEQAKQKETLKEANDRVYKLINNAFSAAFVGGDIFKKIPQDERYEERYNLKQENINRCDEIMETLRPFVVQYSQDYLWRSDPTLMDALSIIELSSKNLILNVVECKQALKDDDYKTIVNKLPELAKVQQKMFALAENLKTMTFNLENKNEVKRILMSVAIIIETSTMRVLKELNMELLKNPSEGPTNTKGALGIKDFINSRPAGFKG